VKVTLTPIELALAEVVAKHRTKNSRSKSISNQRISKDSDFEVEYVGMCGELAVAKALKVYPDLGGSMQPYDLMSRGGKRMEVKTTRRGSGRLVARLKASAEDSDYFVLVTGNPPYMYIEGYTPTKEFLVRANIGQLSPEYPECFLLPQSKLTEWPSTLS
jgi:hypothetical protein